MLRVDYEGMTLDLNGVRDDIEASEYWRESDRMMDSARARLFDLVSEYDIEVQEIGTNYFMFEDEEHLELVEANLENFIEELADLIMEEYEEEDEE